MAPVPRERNSEDSNPSPLPVQRPYPGVKKRRGPKPKETRDHISSQRVQYPYRSRNEAAAHFRLPESNLSRWLKEELEGKFANLMSEQYRKPGGGRRRRWEMMEECLVDKFQNRRN